MASSGGVVGLFVDGVDMDGVESMGLLSVASSSMVRLIFLFNFFRL